MNGKHENVVIWTLLFIRFNVIVVCKLLLNSVGRMSIDFASNQIFIVAYRLKNWLFCYQNGTLAFNYSFELFHK